MTDTPSDRALRYERLDEPGRTCILCGEQDDFAIIITPEDEPDDEPCAVCAECVCCLTQAGMQSAVIRSIDSDRAALPFDACDAELAAVQAASWGSAPITLSDEPRLVLQGLIMCWRRAEDEATRACADELEQAIRSMAAPTTVERAAEAEAAARRTQETRLEHALARVLQVTRLAENAINRVKGGT